MRVQRAPAAADQPQRPPVGADRPSADFSARVDLDLTGLDETQVVGEVVVRLVAACVHQRLLDHRSVLRFVTMDDAGLVGTQVEGVADQSATGITAALTSLSATLPAVTPLTLTVVHLGASRTLVVGDWGWGGLGVATLGAVAPVLAPVPGHDLGVTTRSIASLTFTSKDAAGVIHVLDSVARSLEARR